MQIISDSEDMSIEIISDSGTKKGDFIATGTDRMGLCSAYGEISSNLVVENSPS
jgi:hypothetical protein